MNLFLILFLMFVPSFYLSQKVMEGTFSDFEFIPKDQRKPLIIHLYTEWCGICKIEFYHLNKDQELVDLINAKFYLINFEPEKTRKKIFFQGQEFKYIRNGNTGIHELALALSKNKYQPVYPVWIILDMNENLRYYHEGVFKPEEMKQKLKEILAL